MNDLLADLHTEELEVLLLAHHIVAVARCRKLGVVRIGVNGPIRFRPMITREELETVRAELEVMNDILTLSTCVSKEGLQ